LEDIFCFILFENLLNLGFIQYNYCAFDNTPLIPRTKIIIIYFDTTKKKSYSSENQSKPKQSRPAPNHSSPSPSLVRLIDLGATTPTTRNRRNLPSPTPSRPQPIRHCRGGGGGPVVYSGSRMASAKSSRSRPAGHSGVFPVGSAAAVGSGGGGGDGGVQLTDKLKIFKTDNFDPDAYVQSKCQTMNEKVNLPACHL
jgi:hypothetical protein